MRLLKTALAAAAAACVAAAGTAAMAADDVKVYVNGEQLAFDVPPMIENERTLVPMRAIFEALGAEVSWDGETATVTAVKGDDTQRITIGSNILYINGSGIELDVPARIVDERTLVPVRAVAESFDAKVDWDGKTQSVLITAENQPEPTDPPSAALLPLDTLSDADMAKLTEHKQLIRYNYEQMALPSYVLSDGKDWYSLMTEDKLEELGGEIYNTWRKNAAAYILKTQIESDDAYELSTPLEMENTELLAGYDKILKSAGLDAETVFDGVYVFDSKSGARAAVAVFGSADTLTDCKYIGIVASKDGRVRYFTAENDIMQADTWYFCEVTKDYRGTISAFKKTDDDTDVPLFVNYCQKAFDEDIYASSKLERKLEQ